MNGEGSIDIVSDVLNEPDIQENYPMDFTGYMYEEPTIEAPVEVPVSEPIYEVSPAQRIQVWAQSPEGQSEEPSSSNQLVNFFGNVIDIAGKTYKQIANQTELQKFKSTPYVTSALNTLGYPSVRKPQTGVDTGMLTTSAQAIKQVLSSMSPMVLILGAGILVFVMMRKK
jgi:hypothetical protein